jgi:hypothetical protein
VRILTLRELGDIDQKEGLQVCRYAISQEISDTWASRDEEAPCAAQRIQTFQQIE